MIRLALPLVALTMIGCTPVPPKTGTPPAMTPCGSHKVMQFVGKPKSDTVAKEIARLSGAKGIRWISPGMAVTMDYREDRLNVHVNDKGVITDIRCG